MYSFTPEEFQVHPELDSFWTEYCNEDLHDGFRGRLEEMVEGVGTI